MIELKRKDFFKVIALTDNYCKNYPIINSIIEGNNTGRVFVDNQFSPKNALIWTTWEVYYLLSRKPNNYFGIIHNENLIYRR